MGILYGCTVEFTQILYIMNNPEYDFALMILGREGQQNGRKKSFMYYF